MLDAKMYGKEEINAEINEEGRWFFAKLAYLTKILFDEDCGVIQEDLLLILAPDAEVAYEKAMALGKRVETFSEGALEGRENWLAVLGEAATTRTGTGGAVDGMPPNLLHPDLRDTYKEFHFLGLRELAVLRGPLADGLEIEVQETAISDDGLASIRSNSEETFLAFSPSGVAISESERSTWNSKLYKQYNWYLAEQVFEISADHAERAGANAVDRLVLINAEGPREAVTKAYKEQPHTMTKPIYFAGLRDVFLVQSDLVDGCELRSLLLELPVSKVQTYAREKSQLSAFATKSPGSARVS